MRLGQDNLVHYRAQLLRCSSYRTRNWENAIDGFFTLGVHNHSVS